VVGILTHVNKRVRPKPAIQLPVASLLQQFTTNPSVMVKNFTLIYIEMGFERISLEVNQGDRLAKTISWKTWLDINSLPLGHNRRRRLRCLN